MSSKEDTPISPLTPDSPLQPYPGDLGLRGKVVFHSNRLGNLQIFMLDLKKQQVTQLTKSSGNNVEPAWSPDGEQIAYVCGVSDTQADLCVMKADGSKNTRLTERNGAVGTPRWSPDGKRIIFHAFWDGNPIGLYTVNIDGSDLTEIVVGSGNNLGNNLWADWSPDGKQIAFVSDRDNNDEIYLIDRDGKNLIRLTNNTARDRYPRWSPNAERILFTSNRDGVSRLYTIQPDGSKITPVTDRSGQDGVGTWVSDEKQIIFATNRGETDETDSGTLMLIQLKNGSLENLLRIDGRENFPDWKP
jgi:TolB protein